MASKADNANRKGGDDQSQMAWNQSKAEEQRDKTSFRSSTLAANADKYNPARLTNAIQQKLIENG